MPAYAIALTVFITADNADDAKNRAELVKATVESIESLGLQNDDVEVSSVDELQ